MKAQGRHSVQGDGGWRQEGCTMRGWVSTERSIEGENVPEGKHMVADFRLMLEPARTKEK